MPKNKKKSVDNSVLPASDAAAAAAPKKARAPLATVTHKHKKAATNAADSAPVVPEETVHTGFEAPVAPLPSHDDIALRAYLYAEARNFENGTPEGDWFRAESELIAERLAQTA